MASSLTQPVALWKELPAYVQDDLSAKGVSPAGFDALNPNYRLCTLNLYVKLHGLRIAGKSAWDYVRNVTRVDLGVLAFNAADVAALKRALTAERTFANPYGQKWNSRELTLNFSAHFNHDPKWGPSAVTVHIDPVGLFSSPGVLPKLEAPFTGLPHLICYYHYEDVESIRQGLLKQGWDPAPLKAGH